MAHEKHDPAFDPSAIWALDEADRPDVVIDYVKKLAMSYCEAIETSDAHLAQKCMIVAISVFSGLFPDPNDPAHKMLLSLFGMLIEASAGKRSHILLKNTGIVPGLKHGFDHVNVASFAISAVELLDQLNVISQNEIHMRVAKILTDAGYYSSRKKEHHMRGPITNEAVRSWVENREKLPAQHIIARTMSENHKKNLNGKDAKNLDAIVTYLKMQAVAVVKPSGSG